MVRTVITSDEWPQSAFAITFWVIYQNPTDYPGKFVVRRQCALDDQIYICDQPECVADSLKDARDSLPGSLRIAYRRDEPQIEEVWL